MLPFLIKGTDIVVIIVTTVVQMLKLSIQVVYATTTEEIMTLLPLDLDNQDVSLGLINFWQDD